MAKKKFIKFFKPENEPKQVIVKSQYYDNLEFVLDSTFVTFGKVIADKFSFEAKTKVNQLANFSDIHPKCRFVENTPTKTYRNILINSYYIVYYVKKNTVTVLDIIYQAKSPANITKDIKKAEKSEN